MEAPVVLYAEDDENDAFFMERAFTRLKLRDALRIVPSGKDAIDYIAAQGRYADRERYPAPTMVILDVKMPELSGLEVLRWVRRQPDFARIPVIMFTSSTQDSDIAYSRDHGANAYLVKPSNAEHLALLIQDLLDAVSQVSLPGAALQVTGNHVSTNPRLGS